MERFYSIPSFPKSNSFSIFETLKLQKNLILDKYVKWGFYPDRELDATNQKYLMDLVSENVLKIFGQFTKVIALIFGTLIQEVYMLGLTLKMFLSLFKKNETEVGKLKR